jgi:transcriptional regulator with XRE-family HTH domain
MKNETTKPTIGPIAFYRADLFQKEKDAAGVSFNDLAKDTGLAKQTVQDVVNGTASKLDPIYLVARRFRIDWLELFDVDRRIVGAGSGTFKITPPKRNGLIRR